MNKFDVRVAFLDGYLVYGGSVKVSYATSLMFNDMGIKTTFFSPGYYDEKNWVLPNDGMSEIVVVPEKRNLFSESNVELIIKHILDKDIKILFITMPCSTIPSQIKEQTNCKIIYWLHSQPFWEIIDKFERAKERGKLSIKKWVEWQFFMKPTQKWKGRYERKIKKTYRNQLDAVDKYIVLCPQYKIQLIDTFNLSNETASKIEPVINTLTINLNPILNKKKEIVYLGRLSHTEKRVDRLLKAWLLIAGRLPEWQLKIYGSGPDEWMIKRQIEQNNIPRVELCGYAKNPQVVYDSASILCLSSTYEGFPLVLTEAQNNGVVPIAFNSFGAAEYIIGENQEYGRLIPPFDIDAYADALYELCTNSALRGSMQEACLTKRYDYEEVQNIPVWQRIISELI